MANTLPKIETSLTISMSANGHHVLYEGTKEELINEGVCSDDMFPSGKKRTSCYYGAKGRATIGDWSIDKIKGGRFEFRKGIWDGVSFLKQTRGIEYESIKEWLTFGKTQAEPWLASIWAHYSGYAEELMHGESTIKASENSLDDLRRALLNVSDLLDDITAYTIYPKIVQARKDKDFQSFLKQMIKS